jgi:hypothetical protein
MASTLQARYARAKKVATTRLEEADRININQEFNDFHEASQNSINLNSLSMKLMDSFHNLQSLHHEWENLIEEMSNAGANEAQDEQEKLDEEIKNEKGFTYFYNQLTTAQTKLQQALQNGLTKQMQFFPTQEGGSTEKSTTGDVPADQQNTGTSEEVNPQQQARDDQDRDINIFDTPFNQTRPQPQENSFNIFDQQPRPQSQAGSFNIFGNQTRPLNFDPASKISYNPASKISKSPQNIFAPSPPPGIRPPITVSPNPLAQNFFQPVTTYQQLPKNQFVPQNQFVTQNSFIPQTNTGGTSMFNRNQFVPQINTTMPQQQGWNYQFAPTQMYQQPQHISFAVPKIPPPRFNGNGAKFRNFWQIYSLVHNNPNYSDAEKLAFLLSCLEGEAKQAFEGYDICDVNYQPVVDLLHKMYGQPNQILTALYQQYDEVPKANDSITSIASTINQMECYLRQLHALGINVEDMGLQQNYLKKLPNSFLLKACSTGMPLTFQGLRDTVIRQMQLEMQFKTSVPSKEKTQTNATSAAPVQKGKPSQNEFSKTEQRKSQQKKCIFCEGSDHRPAHCKKYATLEERKNCLKKRAICENCFKQHDSSKRCSPLNCFICKKWEHPTVLCSKSRLYQQKAPDSKTNAKIVTKAYAVKVDVQVSKRKEIAMPITQAKIYNPKNAHFEKVDILLDSASASTFINEKLAASLQLPIIKENILLEISRFGDSDNLQTESKVVIFHVEAENGEFIELDAYTIPTLTQALPKMDKDSNQKVMVLPEILIGNDHYGKIVLSEELANGFSKIPSRLGPIICGTGTFVHSFSTKVMKEEEDSKEIKGSHHEIPKFWDTENFASDNWQDDELVQHFCKTAKIIDGRIQIELPFAKDPATLPSNKLYATKCIESSLKRLAANPDYLMEYDSQINYLKDNLMVERIPDNERFLKGHYLSHHGVITPGKTTPLRVVFNCSGRMSKNSPCLNDFLDAGPPLMPKIVDVLLRYRMAKIIVMGDVQKAFLQIKVAPQHRQYLRFFWLKSAQEYLEKGFDPANIIAYQFGVVLFGCKISPFFMNIALMVLFDSMEDKKLGEELKVHTYADNGAIKAETEEEAIYKAQTTIDAFASVKMNFRGIMSNSDTVRKHFKVEPSIMSMLGLKWDPRADVLSINLTAAVNLLKLPVTKRSVTAEIGKKYDPLGFIAPVVLRYKIFLQKLWTSNLEWDKPLPPEMAEEWKEMLKEEIEFETPRFTGSPFKNSTTDIQGFVDASKGAYAVVIYLVHKDLDSDQQKVEFLICKTKVAPLKPISIPRIELLAALLGAKVLKYILQILPQLIGCKMYLWTDSSAVFYWLQTDKHLKTFVKNRVNIIKESNLIIRHVPTKDNPADVASRGCTMDELKNNNLWRNGPSWLTTSNWPSNIKFNPKIEIPEIINEVVCAVKATVTEPPELLYSAEKTSSWIKMVRVIGQCIKFGNLCRKKDKSGQLTAADIEKVLKI